MAESYLLYMSTKWT